MRDIDTIELNRERRDDAASLWADVAWRMRLVAELSAGAPWWDADAQRAARLHVEAAAVSLVALREYGIWPAA